MFPGVDFEGSSFSCEVMPFRKSGIRTRVAMSVTEEGAGDTFERGEGLVPEDPLELMAVGRIAMLVHLMFQPPNMTPPPNADQNSVLPGGQKTRESALPIKDMLSGQIILKRKKESNLVLLVARSKESVRLDGGSLRTTN